MSHPAPKVDMLIALGERPHRLLALVERCYPPLDWAMAVGETLATATGAPQAGDDAQGVGIVSPQGAPHPLGFDHSQMLQDSWNVRYFGIHPHR